MKNKLAVVKNIERLQDAFGSLESRHLELPGMALIYGYTGAGKTFAITHMMARVRGVFVRSWATWTPNTMMAAITRELGGEPTRNIAPMIDFVVRQLVTQNRPLFVDEVNYIDASSQMMHLLRDLHDTTGVPVVMISEENTPRKINRYPQIASRIYESVAFSPLDMEDIGVLAETLCEVQVSDDLLAKLHRDTDGNMRMATDGLAKIERTARASGISLMSAEQWGARKFVFGQR